MAKQTGLYHIRGKVGDYKYYGMKGVDGTIMAKQNEGMSERVKTDAAYDNTRRNNYEFGMATSTAGAITRAFSQKWRYLLVPFATAKIAKEVLAAAKGTSTSDWGDRFVENPEILPLMASVMPKYVKNDISDFSDIAILAKEEEGASVIVISGTNLTNDKAKAAGCDGVRVLLFDSKINVAEGGYGTSVINPGSCANQALGSQDVDFGTTLEMEIPFTFGDNGNLISAVLLPYRTIGTEKYIMQEFCSAKFVHVVEP